MFAFGTHRLVHPAGARFCPEGSPHGGGRSVAPTGAAHLIPPAGLALSRRPFAIGLQVVADVHRAIRAAHACGTAPIGPCAAAGLAIILVLAEATVRPVWHGRLAHPDLGWDQWVGARALVALAHCVGVAVSPIGHTGAVIVEIVQDPLAGGAACVGGRCRIRARTPGAGLALVVGEPVAGLASQFVAGAHPLAIDFAARLALSITAAAAREAPERGSALALHADGALTPRGDPEHLGHLQRQVVGTRVDAQAYVHLLGALEVAASQAFPTQLPPRAAGAP
mmetsp:Transcript_1337/g.2730  ORF Transcript_1337/g.2730 Transcript_1337/m.2730 type:complete len:281 (-) Transcript_1337:10-852(-)